MHNILLKTLAVLLTVVVVGQTLPSASYATSHSAEYLDLDSKNKAWYYDTLVWGVNEGIINGYEEHGEKLLLPQRAVTEAEFLSMLLRFYPQTKKTVEHLVPSNAKNWSDAYYAAAALYSIPILQDGRIPGTRSLPVKRGQVAQMIASTFGNVYSVSEAIKFLFQKGLAEGRSGQTIVGFEPDGTLTRAEAVRFLEKVAVKGGKERFLPPAESVTATRSDEESPDTALSRLGIYYGTPSLVNDAAGNLEKAVQAFEPFDLLILGDGVEHPDYWDWERSSKVVATLVQEGKQIFGYVDLGVKTSNHSYEQMENDVDEWKRLGAYGIYLDNAGYDFDVTRERQNHMIDYIHQRGLRVFMGAWNPDDVNGDYDEKGRLSPSRVKSGDWYLSESWLFSKGAFMPVDLWLEKTAKCDFYQETKGIRTAAVSTVPAGSARAEDGSGEAFAYAWWAAAMHGFSFQWTDFHFSADRNTLIHYKDLFSSWAQLAPQQPIALSGTETVARTRLGIVFLDGDGVSFGRGALLRQQSESISLPSINENMEGWTKQSAFEQSEGGSLKVVGTTASLHLLLETGVAPSKGQLYIRTDAWSDNGYLVAPWQKFRADYLLEGNRLYHYSGIGDDWKWSLIKTLNAPEYTTKANGKIVEIGLDFTDLSLEPGQIHLLQMSYFGDDRTETAIPAAGGDVPIYFLTQ